MPAAVKSAAVIVNMSTRRLKRPMKSMALTLHRRMTGRGSNWAMPIAMAGPSGRSLWWWANQPSTARFFVVDTSTSCEATTGTIVRAKLSVQSYTRCARYRRGRKSSNGKPEYSKGVRAVTHKGELGLGPSVNKPLVPPVSVSQGGGLSWFTAEHDVDFLGGKKTTFSSNLLNFGKQGRWCERRRDKKPGSLRASPRPPRPNRRGVPTRCLLCLLPGWPSVAIIYLLGWQSYSRYYLVYQNFSMSHPLIFLISSSSASRPSLYSSPRLPQRELYSRLHCHKGTSVRPPPNYWYTSFFFLAGLGPLHEIAVSALSQSIGPCKYSLFPISSLTPRIYLHVLPLSRYSLALPAPLIISLFSLIYCIPKVLYGLYLVLVSSKTDSTIAPSRTSEFL